MAPSEYLFKIELTCRMVSGCNEKAAGTNVCMAVGNAVVADAPGAVGCSVIRGVVAEAVCSGWYGCCIGNGSATSFWNGRPHGSVTQAPFGWCITWLYVRV